MVPHVFKTNRLCDTNKLLSLCVCVCVYAYLRDGSMCILFKGCMCVDVFVSACVSRSGCLKKAFNVDSVKC